MGRVAQIKVNVGALLGSVLKGKIQKVPFFVSNIARALHPQNGRPSLAR